MTDTTWPPPWTLKPAYKCPETGTELCSEVADDIHWSLSFGFAFNVNHADQDDPTSPLTIECHWSDADAERGMVKRQVTPEQLDRLALLLMAKAARVRQGGAP
jgi:hypothetical protein